VKKPLAFRAGEHDASTAPSPSCRRICNPADHGGITNPAPARKSPMRSASSSWLMASITANLTSRRFGSFGRFCWVAPERFLAQPAPGVARESIPALKLTSPAGTLCFEPWNSIPWRLHEKPGARVPGQASHPGRGACDGAAPGVFLSLEGRGER